MPVMGLIVNIRQITVKSTNWTAPVLRSNTGSIRNHSSSIILFQFIAVWKDEAMEFLIDHVEIYISVKMA